MKQPFEYTESEIERGLQKLGIDNIALNSTSNISDSLNNVMCFLDLDKLFEIDEISHDRYRIQFTLIESSNSDQAKFREGIKKFQEHFKVYYNSEKRTPSEIIIDKIKNFISTIPEGDYEIVFHASDVHEDKFKIELGIPKYWYYVHFDSNRVNQLQLILEYFISLGYKNEGSKKAYPNLFVYTRKIS